MKSVAIIGAGPVGNFLGYQLAKAGVNVVIYEENAEIGRPVQCTGILTSSLKDYIELDDEFIVNTMKHVEVFSPHNYFKIKSNDIIVCRTAFDQHLGKLAERAGAVIKRGHRFVDIEQGKLRFKTKEGVISESENFDYLIGADGPNSVVSKMIGNPKPQFYFGKQALVKGTFEPHTFQVYLGNTVAPKFFGWSVPENEEFSRVGVATLETPAKYFDELIKRMNLDGHEIVEFQGGLIPIYNPNIKLTGYDKENDLKLALVGDAALQVKATTGGGIIPAMEAALGLSKSILNNTSYEKEIANVKREMKLHLLIRNTLDNFSDKDYDRLVGLLGQKRLEHDLLTVTRDRVKQLAVKLILKEPRLAFFARKLLF